MIRLTRLNGEAFVLNADLIRYVEERPDTFVTLNSGDRVVVKESMDEVLLRTVRYQQVKQLVPPVGTGCFGGGTERPLSATSNVSSS